MSTKFEQLLDYLVNEETEKANELFHEIVVEKSRNIYENLIAEEDDEDDEEMDESMENDEEEMDESMKELEDSYEMEADDDTGGFDKSDTDATGDLGTDIAARDDMDDMDDMDGEADEEADEDQAIMDIKSAIEELEAAFSELERAHEEEGGEEDEFGDEEDDEFGDEEGEEGEEGADEMFENRRLTREFIELPKMGKDWDRGSQHTDGDIVGANTGEQMPKAKSGEAKTMKWGNNKPVSNANAGNLNQGATEGQKNTGTTPNKVNKGITPESGEKFTKTTWEDNSSPGKTKARKLTPVQGAHGLAKGSASDSGKEGTAVGAGSGDNSVTGATNTKTIIRK